MQAKGYSSHELASGTSVPKARVVAWMGGSEVPTRREYGKICVHLPRMRGCRPPRYADTPGGEERVEVVPSSPPPGTYGAGDYGPDSFGGSDFPEVVVRRSEPVRAATFGAALRREREAEGLTLEELGATVGVTRQAVSEWELDASAPVRAHYEDLLALFPRLAGEPEPDWKDIEKPDGGAGRPRGREEPPPPPPPGSGGSARGPNPVELLVTAYAEVYGGAWEARVSTAEGRWSASVACADRGRDTCAWGASVDAACAALLVELDEELAERVRDLEALRARVRGGGRP